jgi:hypothetical protein
MMRTGSDRRPWLVLAAVLLVACWALPRPAAAQDEDGLLDLLEEVGSEYAKGYMAPLGTAFGVNQNSAVYHTAAIPKTRITVGIGLKFMSSTLSDDDATFRKVVPVTLDERFDINPGDPRYGETGTVVIEGPTIFGDEDTDGTITAYYGGIPIWNDYGIEGAWDTSWVPLFAPQAEVGGIAGLRATLRWLPEIEGPGDLGKVKFFGYGLQYSISQHIPQPPAGLDFMVGFFSQSLDLGEAVETDATSYFVAASKTFAVATLYGGVSFESSSIDVAYTPSLDAVTDEQSVSFSLDGEQERRLTLGGTLNLGVQVNAELAFGKLTSFNAGAMFGF